MFCYCVTLTSISQAPSAIISSFILNHLNMGKAKASWLPSAQNKYKLKGLYFLLQKFCFALKKDTHLLSLTVGPLLDSQTQG